MQRSRHRFLLAGEVAEVQMIDGELWELDDLPEADDREWSIFRFTDSGTFHATHILVPIGRERAARAEARSGNDHSIAG
jgi:hypothetical protein